VPTVNVSLDAPPEQRWLAVAAQYKSEAHEMLDYLLAYIPKWAIPIVEKIGLDLEPSFGKEFAAELKGLAKALDINEGEAVVLQLVYQLEEIGINCSGTKSCWCSCCRCSCCRCSCCCC